LKKAIAMSYTNQITPQVRKNRKGIRGIPNTVEGSDCYDLEFMGKIINKKKKRKKKKDPKSTFNE
jgi:hypothetical protein